MEDRSTAAYTDAMNALNDFEYKVNFLLADGETNSAITRTPKNTWVPVESTIFETGYARSMSIGGDLNGTNYAIVHLAPKTKTLYHYHSDMIEEFLGVKGKLYYEIYEDEDKKHLVRSGTVKHGESVKIDRDMWHLVLTAEEETYIITKFKHS